MTRVLISSPSETLDDTATSPKIPGMILLLFAFLHLRAFPGTFAAPTSTPVNTTSEEQYLAWQSQSNIRGTWDILVNCVVTMSLCIWTALHLNLPISEEYIKKKPWWIRLWYHSVFRQVRWVFVGLIAPELVVYMAWTQCNTVKYITQQAKEAQYEFNHEEPNRILPMQWTTAHSWYLLMGGFYFETNDLKAPQFIPHSPRLILTANCITLLACTTPPLLPDIDAEVILDCSKADQFTKFLALLQAVYMVIQSIGRLVAHLPVSQLEINTVGHVLCAVAIYWFWFEKPKDVRVRTPIREPWARPLCAYMWMCDKRSTSSKGGHPEIARMFPIIEERFNPITLEYAHPESDPCHTRCHGTDEKTENLSTRFRYNPKGLEIPGTLCEHGLLPNRPKTKALCRHVENTFWHSWLWIDVEQDAMPFIEIAMPILWKNFRFPTIDVTDEMACVRFNLALQYFQYWSQRVFAHHYIGRGGHPFHPCDGRSGFDLPPFDGSISFAEYCHDWQPTRTFEEQPRLTSYASIAILTFCYGGLHASAWSTHFPSLFELLAWKVSVGIIASSGLITALECTLCQCVFQLRDKLLDSCVEEESSGAERTPGQQPVKWLLRLLPLRTIRMDCVVENLVTSEYRAAMTCAHPLVVGFVLLCLLSFMLARVFIVVEAFLSLRSMPAAMYDNPNWTPWVPHI